MARKKIASSDSDAEFSTGTTTAGAGEGNVSAYFKKLFQVRPDLLKERNNEPIYTMWLADHPSYDFVPKNVQQGLSNVKSQMRRDAGIKPSRGKKLRKARSAPSGNGAPRPAPASKLPTRELETLEVMIDESVLLARSIGGASLQRAIDYLRKARIEVGLKLGL
jgi:hypothetical protein